MDIPQALSAGHIDAQYQLWRENPEAAVHAIRLAADYRMEFKKDGVIDEVYYRRWGHNEGDEPYYTQPRMVERIRNRLLLNRLYADALIGSGRIERAEIESGETAITGSPSYHVA